MHVYIAGGTGAIGQRLVPQLVARGHRVTSTTRDARKIELIEGLGAEAVVVDALDSAAVGESVAKAEPDAVVHQLSALSGKLDVKHFDRSFAMTNRLRTEGLDHLIAAAQASGVPHVVTQSYTGWPNIRSGSWVKDEEDPLDPEPPRAQRETLDGIRYLEDATQKVDGTVLRYGGFYGDASNAMVPVIRKRQFPLAWTTRRARPCWRWRRGLGESSTSWTTSPPRRRSGCPTWPSASARSHRCGSHSGSRGSQVVRWPCRC